MAHQSRLLTVLLALAVAGSYLAVGSVHVETTLWFAPLALLAGAVALVGRADAKPRVPGPAWVAVALSAWSWLQSVPLPGSWLQRLSPVAARTWREARELWNLSPDAWASLSVDPGASRLEGLKWLCYAATFVAAERLSRQSGQKRGATLLFGIALLGSLLTLAHGLLGIRAWLFVYQPEQANPPWAVAPLLNPNNHAGYLNLAIFTGLGLMLMRRPPLFRWAIGLGLAILTAMVVLTASRGGVASLVLGLLVAGIALRAPMHRSRTQGLFVSPWLPVIVVASGAMGFALLGATPDIWQGLLDETTEKLRMADYVRPLLADHPWSGIGRGAFETAFAAYRVTPGHTLAQHAENFVVQWLVEWGLPVGGLGLFALAWMLRPTRLGFGRHTLPTSMLIGLWVLLLQNLADLGLEITSVALAASLLTGTLYGGVHHRHSHARQHDESPSTPRARTWLAPALAGVGLVLCVSLWTLAFVSGRPDAMGDRKAARALIAGAPRNPSPASKAQLKAAMLRHPADPYLPMAAAILAEKDRENPLPFVNQALRRDPENARAHLLLAEVLASRKALPQALLALRNSVEKDAGLVSAAAKRADQWTSDPALLRRAVPEGRAGAPFLNALAQRAGRTTRRALHDQLLADSLIRDPDLLDTREIVARDLLADLAQPQGPCSDAARPACEARLDEQAKELHRIAPDSLRDVLLRAAIQERRGSATDAEQLLAKHCPRFADSHECARDRLTYAERSGNKARLDEASLAYLTVACRDSSRCAGALTELGDLEMRRGNPLSALERFERAAREVPSTKAWLRVADAALKVQRPARAESALRHARRYASSEDSTKLEQRIEELARQQLLRTLQK